MNTKISSVVHVPGTDSRGVWAYRVSFEHGLFTLLLHFIYRTTSEGRQLSWYGLTVERVNPLYKPRTESALFYGLLSSLNVIVAERWQMFGYTKPGIVKPFIKKLMSKDGHMTSDYRYYIRTAGPMRKSAPYWGITDDNYAIADCGKVFCDTGHVYLTVNDLKPDKADAVVLYGVSVYGYVVQVVRDGVIDESKTYTAGNAEGDSTLVVDCSSKSRVKVATLRKYAKQTALEIAAESGIDADCVGEDRDIAPQYDEGDF